MNGEEEPLRVEVLRGNPTEDELAAVIAVVGTAYLQERSGAVATEGRRSAWSISQRPLRRSLGRDLGWGGFGPSI